MSIFDTIGVISLLLAIVSILFTLYAWRHPIDASFKNQKVVKDKTGLKPVIYAIGRNHETWAVKKTDLNAVENGEIINFIADIKNNPNVKAQPSTLEEVKQLKYRAV
jgi:hypothetical protein